MQFFHRALLATIFSAALLLQAAGQTPTDNPQDQKPATDNTQSQKPAPGSPASGQQQTLPESPKPQTQPTPQQSEKDIQKKEQSERILGVAPQFFTTSRMNAPPLSTSEKFHLFVKSGFDPFVWAAAGFQAGLGQATNEFPGYGQGAAGYGKRYGATFADQLDANFMSNFFYPVLLREDPRYFRLGEGSIKHRILYSLAQEFVVHKDKGGQGFNWSNVLGAFTTGGISNAYYPSTDRGLGLTMSRSVIALGYGSLGGLIDEFWTDIHNKMFHKHSGAH